MGSFLLFLIPLFIIIPLVLPIIFHLNLYLDAKSGKIGCNIKLLGIITILGGYLLPCPGGFAWHISEKKAILFSYQAMNDGRRKLSTDKVIHVRSIQLILEISPQYLIPISIADGIFKIITPLVYRNTYLNSEIFLQHEDVFRAFGKIRFQMYPGRILMKYLFKRGTPNVKG